jgi:aspartate/tyrosine/aromatic aminotransferase
MFFHEIPEGQPDPIFGLNEAFQADVRPNKVNLIVGIYKDDQLRAHLMESVRKVKNQINNQDLLADYLPIDGLHDFQAQVGMLVFGEKRWKENHSRIYAAQTVGGTGALQLGGQFLAQEVSKSIAISTPTWPNHRSVFERAGLKVETYPYYNREKHGIDFDGFCSSLKRMPEKTPVLLHAICHNPTGCDFSIEQWKELSRIILERRILPFFDFAYQGLGEGLEKDRQAIEIFMNDGHEMLIAYSCAKNFSLYCQRVGALFVVDENAAVKLRVGSQIKKIIRSLYSNPPAHGARIVSALLQAPSMKEEWKKELDSMRHRIAIIRESLIQRLSTKCSRVNFEFLRHHKGMFSFIDLDKSQVQQLIDKFGIYLTDNGRISLTGLNSKNIDYVVSGIAAVCS